MEQEGMHSLFHKSVTEGKNSETRRFFILVVNSVKRNEVIVVFFYGDVNDAL